MDVTLVNAYEAVLVKARTVVLKMSPHKHDIEQLRLAIIAVEKRKEEIDRVTNELLNRRRR